MKKALVIVVGVLTALSAVAFVLYQRNPAPVVAKISSAEAMNASRPYVVKLHAQWCPVCMLTKDVWTQIEQTYSGRVNFLVLDFTNDATTEASRAEAARLGLESFYTDSAGVTGAIVVLNTRSKEIEAWIQGSRDVAEYSAAIDAALKSAT